MKAKRVQLGVNALGEPRFRYDTEPGFTPIIREDVQLVDAVARYTGIAADRARSMRTRAESHFVDCIAALARAFEAQMIGHANEIRADAERALYCPSDITMPTRVGYHLPTVNVGGEIIANMPRVAARKIITDAVKRANW